MERRIRSRLLLSVSLAAVGAMVGNARAVIHDVSVEGPDAIFLAGRTDVVIPPASEPWTGPGTHLTRHGGPTPEEALEQVPQFIPVAGGDTIRVLDPVDGGVNFFNGFGPPFFGPEGNTLSGSDLTPLDGISGYKGPQGPLAGVFLSDATPSSGPAPATLDFTPAGLGIDFPTLSPELGQVFFIGNGVTSGGDFQTFIAPSGATRLFLAIPDGFGFGGAPGAYDDNDGVYRVRVGVNEIPVIDETPPGVTPEPITAITAGLASLALGFAATARRR